MPPRIVKVIDTKDSATKMRENFTRERARREQKMPFGWPPQMQEIGSGKAIMYRSNKWQPSPTEFEDYKHVAEADQRVYVVPGFLRDYNDPRERWRVEGPMVEFREPMPKHFTKLAPLLGVQLHLDGYKDEGYVEVKVARAWVGAAKHPVTKETMVFVFTNEGVHILFTGPELDVERDGIVG